MILIPAFPNWLGGGGTNAELLNQGDAEPFPPRYWMAPTTFATWPFPGQLHEVASALVLSDCPDAYRNTPFSCHPARIHAAGPPWLSSALPCPKGSSYRCVIVSRFG